MPRPIPGLPSLRLHWFLHLGPLSVPTMSAAPLPRAADASPRNHARGLCAGGRRLASGIKGSTARQAAQVLGAWGGVWDGVADAAAHIVQGMLCLGFRARARSPAPLAEREKT